ncbi:Subtilisin-like protease 2 [Fulvia fulva]|nr:Subtilisin-like protease 2 [Fulvia fulva]KAK4620748.1 Subtilisin-like protease 2 [Fulvia fulva]WPV17579.1 Subtilisin-like protease 2 [Fulvia fulva]WPV32050.1 Subtilisin-like protease 2 [Fulvia fulva]
MQLSCLLTLWCGWFTLINAAATNSSLNDGIIPDAYIVTVHDGFDVPTFIGQLLEQAVGSEISHVYESDVFNGFAFRGRLTVMDRLLDLAGIRTIEPDRVVKLDYVMSSKRAEETQTDAPWGLARISHNKPGAKDYVYNSTAKDDDIIAYVIDTGIYIEHEDFSDGRAVHGWNFVDNSTNGNDDNGHGTHVAGTIGGTTYGVAKGVHLIAVKVLDAAGSGTTSGIIAAISWAVDDMNKRGKKEKAVANMSLGGFFSEALNTAVDSAVTAGLFFGVAAGNEGLPAYFYSPASARYTCTVAATDEKDKRAYFSNWGSSNYVDISAPGVNIKSAWIDYSTAANTISGTSMATPHVVGVAAAFLTASRPRVFVVTYKRRPQQLLSRSSSMACCFTTIVANEFSYRLILRFPGHRSLTRDER